MPLPANVTTVTVLGTFLTPEGDPSTGTVSFTPSSWLTNSGANVAIPNSSVVKTLGTAGNFSAVLPITDDPDLSPGGWVYGVSEVVDGVSQSYNILIPGTVAVGGTVFLADLVPAAPAGPEYYSLASSLAIGTVTTVATGGSATATITGLAPSQVLNLGIPTGATGTVASAGSGSVGTAAVAPTGDPNTGIYFPAADQVGITTGGSAAAIFAAGAISNPTFTGVASFPDGSASAPSITNTGDTDTGLAFVSDNTIAVTTAGTERARISATGQVIQGHTTAVSFAATVSTPVTQIHGTDSNAAIGAARYSNNTSGPSLYLLKSRGTATGSLATITTGDSLGGLIWSGVDSDNLARRAAGVFAGAEGTIAAGTVPGNLQMLTANSSGTLTERMRLDSNGLITGTGTSLGAWTAYTPTLGGTGWAIGDGTVVGRYCQIGKLVVFQIIVTFGGTSTFGAGSPTLTFPITSTTNSVGLKGRAVFVDTSLSQNYGADVEQVSTTTVACRTVGTNGLHATTTSSVPFTWANTDVIRINGVYEAA